MMTRESLSIGIAVLVYGLALFGRIELDVGEVTLGAAFAPALALLSQGSVAHRVIGISAGAAIGMIASLLTRRSVAPWREVAALFVCMGAVTVVEVVLRHAALRTDGSATALGAGCLGLAAYSLVADGLQHLRTSVAAGDRRVWLLLQGVFASAYGLMILVYRQVGWPALVAMLVLLGLTKREFDRYAMARRAFAQTVEALTALRQASLS